jgi:hypothetical protein
MCVFGLVTAGLVGGASPAGAVPTAAVCSGGSLSSPPASLAPVASGNYSSLTITGDCIIPDAATVVVHGPVIVAPGAGLDDYTEAVFHVDGNVIVGQGAIALLGCNFFDCEAPSDTHIHGSVLADAPLTMDIDGAVIDGNVISHGGGPGPSVDPSSVVANFAFKDNTIGGNVNLTGWSGWWLGVLRDQVAGNVTVSGISGTDPDSLEVSENVIGGDMTCRNNTPAIQFGEGGTPNSVGGDARGQCGFRVLLPNPAPESGVTGPLTPIAVPAWTLGTHKGTHVQTATSLTGTDTKGPRTLYFTANNDTLGGGGLTGSVNEQVSTTAYPNGSQSFTAVDDCNPCTFHGKTGEVGIMAYGRTSPTGITKGTFIIFTASGELATLTGNGTFTNIGQPAGSLKLTEHLRIT